MKRKKSSNMAAGYVSSIYQFLISLKLAVVLICLLIVSLAAGTILESLHGASTAKILVYNAGWFTLILLLLGLNVFSVAMSRFPWKKKHIGFLLTHLGIILILVGSLITRFFMTDGQLVLIEGESGSSIMLPDEMLQISRVGDKTTWSIPVTQKAFPWQGRERIGTPGHLPVTFYMTRYYPKAKGSEGFREADTGPGVLALTLKSSMTEQEMWLREDTSGRSGIELGPAAVTFSTPFKEASQPEAKENFFLEFRWSEKVVKVDLPESLEVPHETALEGTPYHISIENIYRNAIVENHVLVENENARNPAAWGNPAIKLTLTGEAIEETHHAFAYFPDFSTIHGREAPQSGVKIRFHVPPPVSSATQHELRFYKDDQKLLYQIKAGEDLSEGEVQLGKDTPMNWMDFEFRIDEYYPHAEKTLSFEPRSNNSTADGVTTALELTLSEKGEEASVWLTGESSRRVRVGENTYRVFFGRKERNLGFNIKLIDFIKETYSGTNKAASFSSDVEFFDAMRGVRKEVTISMNEPLEYRGYKIYQSAYRERPGQPDISIFSVGHDPGIPLNYLGSIILVSGILVMMFTRKRKQKKK